MNLTPEQNEAKVPDAFASFFVLVRQKHQELLFHFSF